MTKDYLLKKVGTITLPLKLFSRGKFGDEGDKESFRRNYLDITAYARKFIVIKRTCLDCDSTHAEIYYKRFIEGVPP